MRLCDVRCGRREPGADGPDRLVGDHGVRGRCSVRNGAVDLAAEHVERLLGVAFLAGFSNANDRDEARAPCCLGFRVDICVGFLVDGAPLGMTYDGECRSRVGEHLGRDIARVGARGRVMAVLSADRHF